MKLTLTDDDGVVLEQWYLPPEETGLEKVRCHIEGRLPVYADREEYEQFVKEME